MRNQVELWSEGVNVYLSMLEWRELKDADAIRNFLTVESWTDLRWRQAFPKARSVAMNRSIIGTISLAESGTACPVALASASA